MLSNFEFVMPDDRALHGLELPVHDIADEPVLRGVLRLDGGLILGGQLRFVGRGGDVESDVGERHQARCSGARPATDWAGPPVICDLTARPCSISPPTSMSTTRYRR